MEIGRLRERVTIEQPTLAQDSTGQALESWAAVRTVWAKITFVAGRETEQDAALRTEITHRVVARAPAASDVTPAWRLRWGERLLYVRHVGQAERRDILTLLCEEEQAG